MSSNQRSPAEIAQSGSVPTYDAWLERLGMTYDSVTNCCRYRLHDRALAQRAALSVIAGLVARPRVFGSYGLPYSGRVAHLTEQALGDASRGIAPPGTEWEEVRAALHELAADEQEIFVLAYVDSLPDDQVAEVLACDEATARTRRERAVTHVQDLFKRAVHAAPESAT
jgi:hypothetical protein